MTDGKPPVITFFASLRQIDRYKIRKSQHIFAKKIKKFQTQAAKAVEKTASADRKPRISRG